MNDYNLVRRSSFACLAIVLTALLTACSNGMHVVENDYGRSVRLMEQSQVYNKAAAVNPSPNAPEGISGNKSLADLHMLERPINAEKEMLNLIKSKKYDVGE